MKVEFEGRTKQHHIVSRGYLRQFATTKPGRKRGRSVHCIRLILKSGEDRGLHSIRNVFAKKHFNSFIVNGVVDATLEDQWQALETTYLPSVRAVTQGDRSATAVDGVKVIMAMHLARSEAHQIVHDRNTVETLDDYLRNHRKDRQPLEHFRVDKGRDPEPGEMEAEITRLWTEVTESGALRIQNMAETYSKALDYLVSMNLHFGATMGGAKFITGDVPVVLVSGDEKMVGYHNGVGIRSAREIFMPLSPRLIAATTTKVRPDRTDMLSPEVLRYNALTWRCAVHAVGVHPDRDWRRDLKSVEWPPNRAA